MKSKDKPKRKPKDKSKDRLPPPSRAPSPPPWPRRYGQPPAENDHGVNVFGSRHASYRDDPTDPFNDERRVRYYKRLAENAPKDALQRDLLQQHDDMRGPWEPHHGPQRSLSYDDPIDHMHLDDGQYGRSGSGGQEDVKRDLYGIPEGHPMYRPYLRVGTRAQRDSEGSPEEMDLNMMLRRSRKTAPLQDTKNRTPTPLSSPLSLPSRECQSRPMPSFPETIDGKHHLPEGHPAYRPTMRQTSQGSSFGEQRHEQRPMSPFLHPPYSYAPHNPAQDPLIVDDHRLLRDRRHHMSQPSTFIPPQDNTAWSEHSLRAADTHYLGGPRPKPDGTTAERIPNRPEDGLRYWEDNTAMPGGRRPGQGRDSMLDDHQIIARLEDDRRFAKSVLDWAQRHKD